MSVADPELEVDDPIAEIGGVFTGRVILPGAEGVDRTTERIREVRVSLGFHTEGRGDTNSERGSERSFPVNVDGSVNALFSLDVPGDWPISYDGALFRVRWFIEARTDLRLRLDPKTRVGVIVVPGGGHGLYRLPHPLPAVSGFRERPPSEPR